MFALSWKITAHVQLPSIAYTIIAMLWRACIYSYSSVCMYHKYKPPDRPITSNGFQGAATSDNAEAWKWKLTALLHNNDKQEVLSREKKDRRDYEQIAALASKMGLYRYL